MPADHPLALRGRLLLDSRDLLRTVLFRAVAARHHGDPHAVRELAVLHLSDIIARYETPGDVRRVPASQQRAAHRRHAYEPSSSRPQRGPAFTSGLTGTPAVMTRTRVVCPIDRVPGGGTVCAGD